MYVLERTTEPAFSPVSLAEAKAHLRVWHDSDDSQITMFLAAAVNRAQQRTGRQLVNVQFTLTLSCFPPTRMIPLPIACLADVVSVSYLDGTNVRQTLSPNDYRVVLGEYGMIFRTAATWPTSNNQPGNVIITYTAGYQPDFTAYAATYAAMPLAVEGRYGCLTADDGSNVAGVYQYLSSVWTYVRPLIPIELKVGILQAVWHAYDNRGEVSAGSPAMIPYSAESIFESFSIGDEFDDYGVLLDQYSSATFTASSGGGSTVAVDSYDRGVAELSNRPAFGLNVDGEAVEDGYRVKVVSNGLTYVLTDDKTAYAVENYHITVNTTAEFVALYEINAQQRVNVRELELADEVSSFFRNSSNTAWLGDT